jgi:hypothetical protein
VWSGAPRTYTDVSNYTDDRMILDVVEIRTNKLVTANRHLLPSPIRFFCLTDEQRVFR